MTLRLCFIACVLLGLAACGGGSRGNTAPVISGLADVTISANQTAMPVTFTVTDDEDAAAVSLAAASSNADLLPNAGLRLGVGGGDRSLTITPVAGRLGSATVTVTATDAGGLQDTATFDVTVVAQDVSFTTFFRNAFAQDERTLPQDVNSRNFQADAGEGDFDDLLGGP